MTRRCSSPNFARSGTVTVEVALTLPIVFMVLFGAVEFARINMLRNSMQNACYEGARRAALPGATADQAREAALQVLNAVGTKDAVVTVDPAVITALATEVTVTVSVPLNSNAWVTPQFTKGRSLTKSCTLTRERTSF